MLTPVLLGARYERRSHEIYLDGMSEFDPDCLDIFVTAHGWAIMRGGQLSLTGARHRAAALEASGVVRLVKVTSDRILAIPGPAATVPPW